MKFFNSHLANKSSLIAALLLISIAVIGQQSNVPIIEHQCGSEPSFETIQYLQEKQSAITDFQIDYSRTTPNQVPITFHVVRKDNGTGGLTNGQIIDVLSDINLAYASANMEFVQCSSIDFIDDTQFFYFGQNEETAMTTAYDVPGTLNIYFVGTLQSFTGNFLCGYTYFPYSNKDVMVVANNCATNGSTMVHELGHFFGLYHTHGKTNGGTTDELNNGTNCIFGGDDVCDTPADPNLNGLVTAGCQYIGTGLDANGMPFDPDTDNIMSYAPTSCRTSFTDGQLQRVGYINQTEKGHLNCNGLTADFIASQTVGHCGQNMVVDFTYIGGNATSWSWDIDSDGIIDYTTQNPTHTYAQDGEYQVSLTVSDGSISLSKGFPVLIKRLDTHAGLFSDDFDTSLANWGIEDTDMGNRWDRITNYQYSGNSIMCINNYDNNQTGELDCLTSKNIDLSTIANPTLEFNLSYQPRYTIEGDVLKVEISNDCGASYDVIYEKTAMDLSTTGAAANIKWFPQQASDWRLETISLAAYANETIHIRFVNESNEVNYLYIDAVNIVEGSALPVEWEEVSAIPSRGVAMVNWSVSSMTNHSHFEVERSRDGVFFEKIGFTNEITSNRNYRWLDENTIAGSNYYRIKQVDLDGSIDYSKIVSVDLSNDNELSIYPSIAHDVLNINHSNNTHIEYTVFDINGKIIQKGKTPSHSPISIAALNNGIYWIKVKANTLEKTERFVKI